MNTIIPNTIIRNKFFNNSIILDDTVQIEYKDEKEIELRLYLKSLSIDENDLTIDDSITKDMVFNSYKKVAEYLKMDTLNSIHLLFEDNHIYIYKKIEDDYKDFIECLDDKYLAELNNILTHIENILEYKEDNNLFNMQGIKGKKLVIKKIDNNKTKRAIKTYDINTNKFNGDLFIKDKAIENKRDKLKEIRNYLNSIVIKDDELVEDDKYFTMDLRGLYISAMKYLSLSTINTINSLFIDYVDDKKACLFTNIDIRVIGNFISKLDLKYRCKLTNILSTVLEILKNKYEDDEIYNEYFISNNYHISKDDEKQIKLEMIDRFKKAYYKYEVEGYKPKIINFNNEMIKISEKYNFNTTDKFEILDKLVDMIKKSNNDDIIDNTLALYAGVHNIEDVKNYKSEYFDLVPKFIYHLHRNHTY